VDVDLGLRPPPGSGAEPWVRGKARGRHGCVREELAAGVIGTCGGSYGLSGWRTAEPNAQTTRFNH
jgi:hypothetical protein